MSASAIADGLVTMFSAASLFGASMVSKDSFQILESSSGSCLMVGWTGLTDTAMNFGNGKERHWTFNLHCYIRDTGNAVGVMDKVWTATDLIIACLDSDDTIQGTAQGIDSISGHNDPEHAYQLPSGALWKDFNFQVSIMEF